MLLFSHCHIIYICFLSGMFICFLSLPLFTPSVQSLSPSPSTLSRMVPPCKPGPAQGFFLLKGSFSLPLCLPGALGPCTTCRQLYCKRRCTKKTESGHVSRADGGLAYRQSSSSVELLPRSVVQFLFTAFYVRRYYNGLSCG